MSEDGTPQGGTTGNEVEIEAVVASVIAKNSGDATKTVEMLLSETYNLRQKNAGLREQLEQLKSSLPQEGQSVLDSDQVNAFEEYRALGTVDSLKQERIRLTELTNQIDAFERQRVVTSVANSNGLNVDVLTKLLAADEAILIEDGERAAIKVKDSEPQDFTEYVEANWKAFEPSLQGKRGTTYVTQGSSKEGVPTSRNLVTEFLEQNKARASNSPFSKNH